MDACPIRSLERFSRTRNIAVVGTRQGADGRILDGIGNQLHGLEITVGTGSKTGFDHVHLQALQLTRNAQFFILGHGSPGRLLAVAQGGVENDQLVSHVLTPVS